MQVESSRNECLHTVVGQFLVSEQADKTRVAAYKKLPRAWIASLAWGIFLSFLQHQFLLHMFIDVASFNLVCIQILLNCFSRSHARLKVKLLEVANCSSHLQLIYRYKSKKDS